LVFFFWSPKACLLPVAALAVIYVLTFILIYATQNKHSEAWRAKVEFFLGMIPVVGKARRHLAIGRFSAALEALISAGLSIIEAWQMSAKASGSVALQRTVTSWIPALRSGKTPAEMLQETRKFPEVFTSQYVAGEISGKLDETLERLGLLPGRRQPEGPPAGAVDSDRHLPADPDCWWGICDLVLAWLLR